MADEAEAATKIQAMFRGGQARKEVQEKKAVPEAAPAPKDAPESEPVCPPAAPAKRARKVVKPITFPAAAAEDSAEKKLGDAAVPPSRWEVMPGAPVPEMHIKQNSVDAVHLQSVNETVLRRDDWW
eukprot:TRINITY_DN21241_c0_g1_i1.p2 TRINITY_DN21241_c0_g1~~TRINITY_DN21241_c0_g1_i1.p2  ORF type:complete len:126 (+),score=36.34 TRINITY_DN21241_c0_g1_i1:72-449(+)